MTRWENLTRKQARKLGIEGEYELMKMEKELEEEQDEKNKYENKESN